MAERLGSNMLETANELVNLTDGAGRPRESDLRRAISTAYYAIFHILCTTIANSMVGGTGSDRSDAAWKQIYRALEHGKAKHRCDRILGGENRGFPRAIIQIAQLFQEMQVERHKADYDPEFLLGKDEVRQKLGLVKIAIDDFQNVDLKDKRAFSVWLLFDRRK